MAVDLSHLRKQWPTWLSGAFARGIPISDRDFLDAYHEVDPPLLSGPENRALIRILRAERGRPPKGTPSRQQLAECVVQTVRSDISPLFLQALAARIRSRESFFPFKKQRQEAWRRDRKWHRSLMRHLYAEFYDLQDGGPFVMHHIFGKVDVANDVKTRSERALLMTHTIMRTQLGLDVPSPATMRNIISQKK